jgi:hypothetical protein
MHLCTEPRRRRGRRKKGRRKRRKEEGREREYSMILYGIQGACG